MAEHTCRKVRRGCLILATALTLLIAQNAHSDPLQEFETLQWQRYRQSAPPLELLLPYRFELHPGTRPGEVFTASDRSRFPSISLTITPAGRDLQQRLHAAVREISPMARIESQSEETVDGVPALIAFVRWTLPEGAGIQLQTMLLCVQQGEHVIIVSATDGAPETGFDARLAESLRSLRLNASGATASTH
jgi:hypothetical protein